MKGKADSDECYIASNKESSSSIESPILVKELTLKSCTDNRVNSYSEEKMNNGLGKNARADRRTYKSDNIFTWLAG